MPVKTPLKQTTLFGGPEENTDAKGENRNAGDETGSELADDFARQFWEMKVDLDVMKNHYLIHEHASRKLHWDLRLEKDGVLKCWAVPKEPPATEGIRRLAVRVEDHPLGYATFEGVIPEGNYGAGKVTIWDSGKYEPVEISDAKWVLVIKGKKLGGKYCLVRLKPRPGEKGDNWLFFRTGPQPPYPGAR